MIDEFDLDQLDDKPLTLAPVFSGDEFQEVCCYAVIVEAWEKRKAGRARRAYHAAFTDAERQTITRWQTKFYRWHLVTGTPHRIMIRLGTLQVLQRAVAFFATI